MSDGEYDQEWDDGDGDGWGSPNENNDESDHEIENNFYEAEGMMRDSPQEALDRFQTVVDMEGHLDEQQFSFNAHKFIIIVSAQLGQYDKMLTSQRALLKMTDKVSRNEVSEAVNRILDLVESQLQSQAPDMAREMYTLILSTLKTYNERLWFTTSLRLARMYLDGKQFDPLEQMLIDLKTACLTPEAAANQCDFSRAEFFNLQKGSMLLEVFAFEIQMCIDLKEQRRMKSVFRLSQNFASTIEDPRVVGIIKECGGKMYMAERKWNEAKNHFNESFVCLVEVGNSRAKTLLKYVILASLLAQDEVDVMSTTQSKTFSNDNEILGMLNLRAGFFKNDIKQMTDVLNDKKINLLGDPFIAQYLDELLRSVRLKTLESICRPYKSVKLSFLSRKINVPVKEIKGLLSELILEERLEGQIDQLKETVDLRARDQQLAQKHRAMQDWGTKMLELHSQLVTQVVPKAAFDYDDDGGMWGY